MIIEDGTVYGEPYKAVRMPISRPLKEWCTEAFGPEGSMSLAQERWYYHDFNIWIRDEADLAALILRWS